MTQLTVHAGSPQDMGLRFVDAVEFAQAGQEVDERHVTFPIARCDDVRAAPQAA